MKARFRKYTVSTNLLIREMDASEILNFLKENKNISQELLELCDKCYKQLTGKKLNV